MRNKKVKTTPVKRTEAIYAEMQKISEVITSPAMTFDPASFLMRLGLRNGNVTTAAALVLLAQATIRYRALAQMYLTSLNSVGEAIGNHRQDFPGPSIIIDKYNEIAQKSTQQRVDLSTSGTTERLADALHFFEFLASPEGKAAVKAEK